MLCMLYRVDSAVQQFRAAMRQSTNETEKPSSILPLLCSGVQTNPKLNIQFQTSECDREVVDDTLSQYKIVLKIYSSIRQFISFAYVVQSESKVSLIVSTNHTLHTKQSNLL